IPALLLMIWMVATSLKADTQIFSTHIGLNSFVPFPPHWGSYAGAMHAVPLVTYLKNTLQLCILTVIGAVGSSAIVAYGFAKMDFPGKGALFLVMISTMALPAQVTMVPIFALFRWMHWFGSYLPLVVPSFFGAPFFIFLLTQFYRTLPNELAEAARVDGAGEWRIFWQIMAPLSKPALVTCALFQFMGTWNDLLGPLLYINNPDKYTLAYGLQQFVSVHGSEWARLMAGSTIFVLPVIVLFFFCQKTFIQGIATTGAKN
ncbi:MAG TPA: carbohydrate ABC transporter permease, partial [Capsulimonadaceae bacterium]|nr:carbohydrate ABC transporter permease [Capsulimonadaceae bacterium]